MVMGAKIRMNLNNLFLAMKHNGTVIAMKNRLERIAPAVKFPTAPY
jgi:hypothetical protein